MKPWTGRQRGQGDRYSLERSPLHYGLTGICWREGTWGPLAPVHSTSSCPLGRMTLGEDSGCSVTCVPASPIMGGDTGCSVTCVPVLAVESQDTAGARCLPSSWTTHIQSGNSWGNLFVFTQSVPVCHCSLTVTTVRDGSPAVFPGSWTSVYSSLVIAKLTTFRLKLRQEQEQELNLNSIQRQST